MAYRRFIDAHVHYPQTAFDPTGSQIPIERQLENLLSTERVLGCQRLCMLSTGNPPVHDAVAKLIKDQPDFIIGFGYIRLGVDEPTVVDELGDMGFRGLKTISPTWTTTTVRPSIQSMSGLKLGICQSSFTQDSSFALRAVGRGQRM